MSEKSTSLLFILINLFGVYSVYSQTPETDLWKHGIALIPYPKMVQIGGDDFIFKDIVNIGIDKDASSEDLFAAEELKNHLSVKWDLDCEISNKASENGIVLIRDVLFNDIPEQGYQIESSPDLIQIKAKNATGLFYGVQTLLQLVQEGRFGLFIKGMTIKDWPDIPMRAVHYDTKHFQENKEYVKNFIRTLARYKINMLVWEWEDKFAYNSHPEVGAPGAFTMKEMQELTRFAQQYHIQIVPLVQGLGHVSFILKHPENKHLREIESNNWGFCPLREGTYEMMSDLLKEAIEATPGSEYIHIGCDETYTLGKGVECGCKEKAQSEGKYALMQVYISRVSEYVKKLNRKPISWAGGYEVNEKVKPVVGLMTPGGFDQANDEASLKNGYPLYVYDPNPGIEHLFLPYFYREYFDKQVESHLEQSYKELTKAAISGKFQGMISTSWNCSGVHNQIWMLRYITAAEYSWSGKNPGLEEFTDKYFINYYGSQSRDVKELFVELNKASYYYMNTFERKVWHWGEVGKTHLPDLPRDDIEYDPFWNSEYKEMIKQSREIIPRMERVLDICEINKTTGVDNEYDFELFESLAKLFRHTAHTYLALSSLENSITKANQKHFDDPEGAYNELKNAVRIIEKNLSERDQVFNEIKSTWEKWQLPKGMSTKEKKYVHGRDQQRNFANRRPDLTFMIYDEQLLGLEEYLDRLQNYIGSYKEKYLTN